MTFKIAARAINPPTEIKDLTSAVDDPVMLIFLRLRSDSDRWAKIA
jgi:hypothetical protein